MEQYINSFPGREITIDRKPHLYFGGTSYLGLQTDPEFQELFIANIKTYGTNYSASRKSNVRLTVFEEAEEHLAALVGSEACTSLSSGYLAGQFVVQHFNVPQYRAFYAPNTHSALYASKVRPYTTFTALNIALRQHISEKPDVVPVVFLDSIEFSGSNYPHFEGLRSLPLKRLILVVDDSHGMGIVGRQGAGVHQMVKALGPKELLVSCSLGKGYGVQAGAVFGTRQRIDHLTRSDFFGGASPASPAAMATLLHSQHIYAEKRDILKQRIQLFLDLLDHPKKLAWMPGHPSFSYSDMALTAHLKRERMIVTSFNYPNEDASAMCRIVLSAGHIPDDIQKLAIAVNPHLS